MPATTYSDSLKVKDALQLYFSQNYFKDGGYNSTWFKIKVGSVYIPFPNTKARVDTVKIHDIHHLITEYTATIKGESEIAAWEIATGWEKFTLVWLLNFGSFFIGMFLYPRSLLRAFLRGRKCVTNLYFKTNYDEILLNKTLGELRMKIGINTTIKNSSKDYFVFAFWCLTTLSLYFSLTFVLLYPLFKFVWH